jgi:hypothetical protein
MNYAILWTARWTRKLLDFLFRIRLRAASQGCRNLLRTSARKGATGTEPRIRTVRQLAAAAGDGSLGFAGSPGQLETSLNSGYLVGPCNSYLEGPTLVFGHCSHPFVWARCSRNRALSDCSLRSQRCFLICRRRHRSQRKERLYSSPPPCGGARFSDARRPRSRSLSDLSPPWTPHHLQEPGLAQVSDGLHMLQRMQTARNLRIHRFLTRDEGLRDEVARRHQAGVRERQCRANACALRLARTVHHCSGQSRSSIRH